MRAEAESRGLPVASKPDSYDICFVADGDTRGFLTRSLGAHEGAMVSPDGEVLGTHQGYFGFTVGQRKGLGLSRPAEDGRPRYVIETRPLLLQMIVPEKDSPDLVPTRVRLRVSRTPFRAGVSAHRLVRAGWRARQATAP